MSDGDFVTALSLSPPQRPGELLETIVALLELAAPLRHLAPELDHDLLTAAIVLHGIGATAALTSQRGGKAVARLGVAALSDQLLTERLAQRPDFPADLAIELRHCILSRGQSGPGPHGGGGRAGGVAGPACGSEQYLVDGGESSSIVAALAGSVNRRGLAANAAGSRNRLEQTHGGSLRSSVLVATSPFTVRCPLLTAHGPAHH